MQYYIIAFLIVVLDQFTKWLVVKYMEIGESIALWEDVFHFTSHRNAGAAFGMLQNQRTFFIIITIVILIGLIYFLHRVRKTQPILSIGLCLVLGGAIGNFIDRVLFGEVVDFFHFVLINFPIFNIADSAITIGIGFVLLDSFLDFRRSKQSKEETM